MPFVTFENVTGEGIVSFEPWRCSGPEYEADHSRFYCHILVSGQRVFEFGCPCGTCGILFRKLGEPANRVSDPEAQRLLGTLESVPPDAVLQRLARVLEPGVYHPVVIEGRVKRVEPRTQDDYFATDVVRLTGLEPPDYLEPESPRTTYYRFGSDYEMLRHGRESGRSKTLVSSVILPLHDPASLDRERVAYWKQQESERSPLTALAVSVVDHQAPAMPAADPTYAYNEQFLLASCLLDGHHRVEAAAETGAAVRVLAFVSRVYSLAQEPADWENVVRHYASAGTR